MKPILFNTDMVRAILDGRKTVTRRVVKPQPKGDVYQMPQGSAWPNYWGQTGSDAVFAPKYHPGDILYVRETWNREPFSHDKFIYRADGCYGPNMPWRPSIHMPREAARLFLRVTGVWAERLKDIEDGWRFSEEGIVLHHGMVSEAWKDFATLWDNTIKPADRAFYSWAANPWVWVIEFERISKEEAVKDAP